jgi:hypothetical protein
MTVEVNGIAHIQLAVKPPPTATAFQRLMVDPSETDLHASKGSPASFEGLPEVSGRPYGRRSSDHLNSC